MADKANRAAARKIERDAAKKIERDAATEKGQDETGIRLRNADQRGFCPGSLRDLHS